MWVCVGGKGETMNQHEQCTCNSIVQTVYVYQRVIMWVYTKARCVSSDLGVHVHVAISCLIG